MPVAQENDFMLFTISTNGNDKILQILKDLPSDKKIQTIALQPIIENGEVQNKDYIVNKILEMADQQGKKPILNIQLNSNVTIPLFNENDLENLQDLGIKTCLTFGHYNSTNQDLQVQWQPMLTKVSHVFFANSKDETNVTTQNILAKAKTSHIQSIDVTDLVESEILNRPANILMSGIIANKTRLDVVIEAAKQLSNTRVIITPNPISFDDVTDVIATKFAINDPDQRIGLKLEIEEILKDKINGPKKLDQYVLQLSQQFKNDIGKIELNPVDIYFDVASPQKLQNIYKQAKYIVSYQELLVNDFNNSCIPLTQAQGTSLDIVNEINLRQKEPIFNTITIKDMKNNLAEYIQENVLERTLNSLKKISCEEQNQLSSHQQISAKDFDLQQNHLINKDYLYEDQDIMQILKASLDKKKVALQPCVSLGTEPHHQEALRHVMFEAISAVNNDKASSVMAINTGGEHWVGMVITKDKENQLTFTYNDPKGIAIEVRQDLTNMIKELAPGTKIIDFKTKQQENDTNCGPFVVDNLIKLARGKPIFTTIESANIGPTLRKHQANILKIQSQTLSVKQGLKAQLPQFSSQNLPSVNHSKMISSTKIRQHIG